MWEHIQGAAFLLYLVCAQQQASGHDSACVPLQVEGENDEQSSTDQASAVKTKNVFIAQNVASLQELGKSLSAVRKLLCLLRNCLACASSVWRSTRLLTMAC